MSIKTWMCVVAMVTWSVTSAACGELAPGDQVVTGDPDYLGALQAFRSYGADVRSIAVDADGLDTNQLEDELKWGLQPACCYVVPNFHNPIGSFA